MTGQNKNFPQCFRTTEQSNCKFVGFKVELWNWKVEWEVIFLQSYTQAGVKGYAVGQWGEERRSISGLSVHYTLDGPLGHHQVGASTQTWAWNPACPAISHMALKFPCRFLLHLWHGRSPSTFAGGVEIKQVNLRKAGSNKPREPFTTAPTSTNKISNCQAALGTKRWVTYRQSESSMKKFPFAQSGTQDIKVVFKKHALPVRYIFKKNLQLKVHAWCLL